MCIMRARACVYTILSLFLVNASALAGAKSFIILLMGIGSFYTARIFFFSLPSHFITLYRFCFSALEFICVNDSVREFEKKKKNKLWSKLTVRQYIVKVDLGESVKDGQLVEIFSLSLSLISVV